MSNLLSTVQEIYSAFGLGDVAAILARLADDVVLGDGSARCDLI